MLFRDSTVSRRHFEVINHVVTSCWRYVLLCIFCLHAFWINVLFYCVMLLMHLCVCAFAYLNTFFILWGIWICPPFHSLLPRDLDVLCWVLMSFGSFELLLLRKQLLLHDYTFIHIYIHIHTHIHIYMHIHTHTHTYIHTHTHIHTRTHTHKHTHTHK